MHEVGVPFHHKLHIAQKAFFGLLVVGGDRAFFEGFFEKGNGVINGRVVKGAGGDVDDIVSAALEEADLGIAPNGELGPGAPVDDLFMKDGKRKLGLHLEGDRRQGHVFLKLAAGAGREIIAGNC